MNDTIDLAVPGGLKDQEPLKDFEVMHFQPFDLVPKRTEATVKGKDGKEFKVTKGAPQVILDLSENTQQNKDEVEKAAGKFATRDVLRHYNDGFSVTGLTTNPHIF